MTEESEARVKDSEVNLRDTIELLKELDSRMVSQNQGLNEGQDRLFK